MFPCFLTEEVDDFRKVCGTDAREVTVLRERVRCNSSRIHCCTSARYAFAPDVVPSAIAFRLTHSSCRAHATRSGQPGPSGQWNSLHPRTRK